MGITREVLLRVKDVLQTTDIDYDLILSLDEIIAQPEIGDYVWIMLNNKPIRRVVHSVIIEYSGVAYVTLYGISGKHEYTDLHKTKKALLDSF